ncbi:MAG: hypothetical protein U9Q03_02975 [Patescibacteria group bacterium]|nr:hypothetical protein [Patescibacteria group bacterium]
MDGKDFDSKEGIAARLGSYAELCGVLEVRRRYATENVKAVAVEPTDRLALHAFYILGRICTDQYGQIVRLNPEVFDDERRVRMADVMTEPEFLDFADAEDLELGSVFSLTPRLRGGCGCGDSCGVDAAVSLPPPGTTCLQCEQEWSLDTLGDHMRVSSVACDLLIDQDEKTFRPLMEQAEREHGAISQWGVERSSASGLDLMPILTEEEVEEIADGSSEPYETPDGIIQDGDMLVFICKVWLHVGCYERACAEQLAEIEACETEPEG